MRACHARGYELGGAGDSAASSVKLRRVDLAASGTRLITSRQLGAELAALRGPSPKSQVPRLAAAPQPLALDAAVACCAAGERVVVISPSSAYHPCGGFRSGGCHAFEESICVQTSLPVSLQRALWLSQQLDEPARRSPPAGGPSDHAEWFCYIPEDGVVLSPSIEVFRDSYTTGYQFLPNPVELSAVISVAMPNRNSRVRDAPMDAPADEEEYRSLLRTKLRAALGAARLVGATVAVLPAVGCGVYRNNPEAVGRALGEALCWVRGGEDELREVLLAGAPQELLAAALAEIGW